MTTTPFTAAPGSTAPGTAALLASRLVGSRVGSRTWPLAATLLAACSSGSGSSGGSDDGTGSTAAGSAGSTTQDPPDPGSTTTPTATTTEGSTTALPDDSGSESSGEPTGTVPAEPGIHWVGRYDASDPNAVRMGWSGVGLVFRFDGTGASVSMNDQSRYFTVVIDGVVQPVLATTNVSQSYVVASGLPAGEHTVELYRRTEGSFGTTVVHDVQIEGELLAPPPVTRRMEIIGDSISAGYGNEGAAPCSFSAETENHFQTYGAIAARTVGAELHTVAWSGKGLVYNFGDDVNEPMPEIYDRTLATEGASWSFEWQPDVVAVNLGTNDFSTDDDPPQGLFVGTYVELLGQLRGVYPDAFLLVLQPSLFGPEDAMVQGYLLDVVAHVQAAGDSEVAYADVNVDWIGSGCDGHPTVATHEGMAARLVEELQAHVGW